MTTPWPDPPGTPEPRAEFASGAALYTGQPHGRCPRCRTPRSEYEGHWCLAPGASREVWRGWSDETRRAVGVR